MKKTSIILILFSTIMLVIMSFTVKTYALSISDNYKLLNVKVDIYGQISESLIAEEIIFYIDNNINNQDSNMHFFNDVLNYLYTDTYPIVYVIDSPRDFYLGNDNYDIIDINSPIAKNISFIVIEEYGKYALYNSNFQYIHEINYTTDTVLVMLNRNIDQNNPNAYDRGYIDGLNDGKTQGFNNGEIQAKEQYGIFYNGSWITAEEYGNIKLLEGKTIGKGEAENGNIGLIGFIPAILGALGAFFFTVGSVEFLGISFVSVVALILTIIAIFTIVKIIWGGK